jgi:simple sugar transport system ATP-binding protein
LRKNKVEEILTLSDRIAVLYKGEIMGIVEAAQADVEMIGLMMAGSRREAL